MRLHNTPTLPAYPLFSLRYSSTIISIPLALSSFFEGSIPPSTHRSTIFETIRHPAINFAYAGYSLIKCFGTCCFIKLPSSSAIFSITGCGNYFENNLGAYILRFLRCVTSLVGKAVNFVRAVLIGKPIHCFVCLHSAPFCFNHDCYAHIVGKP